MIIDNSQYIPQSRKLNSPKKTIQFVGTDKDEFWLFANDFVTKLKQGIKDGKFSKNLLINVLGTVKGVDLFRIVLVEGDGIETAAEAGKRFCIYPYVTKVEEDLYDLALQGISFVGDLKNVISLTPKF